MTNNGKIWPEGEQFTKEVLLHTEYEPLPVVITFTVPPFDVVVQAWQNSNPAKAYGLFRQFIVSWDQQERLTDEMLISFLYYFSGLEKSIYNSWAEYMKDTLPLNMAAFLHSSNAMN
ncbi:hypothetical protein [Dickeya fangzhongdai]|uniref:hypothetical protein n=1 Tax=Dickeya fangzhongdai TaxID=1778540 RepID=UPI0023E35352|nr:hypothetical protein [Dickeya fangzhongdai]WES90506.1 hypothetical protein PQ617_08415 [Dickeya fangzhongdai]